jgi:hypothetical protein
MMVYHDIWGVAKLVGHVDPQDVCLDTFDERRQMQEPKHRPHVASGT